MTAARPWVVAPPPEPDPSLPIYQCERCRNSFGTLDILMRHPCHVPSEDILGLGDLEW